MNIKRVVLFFIIFSLLIMLMDIFKIFRKHMTLEEQLIYYNEQLFNSPENIELHAARAEIYVNMNKPQAALRDINIALNIENDDTRMTSKLYMFRAHLYYYYFHQRNEAVEDLTSAIALEPSFSLSYRERGKLYLYMYEFDNAINDLNNAVEKNDEDIDTYIYRAMAYCVSGDREKGFNDFSKAMEIKKDHFDAYWHRSMIYLIYGEPDKALFDAQKAVKINDAAYHGFQTLGNIYFSKQDYKNAYKNYVISSRKQVYLNEYSHVMMFVTGMLSGENRNILLHKLKHFTSEEPLSIIPLFLSDISYETFANMYQKQSKLSAKEQMCEIEFYAGCSELIKENYNAARVHFKKCVDSQCVFFIEYQIAKGLLKQLNK